MLCGLSVCMYLDVLVRVIIYLHSFIYCTYREEKVGMNADMAMHTVLDSRYTSLIKVVLISFRWLIWYITMSGLLTHLSGWFHGESDCPPRWVSGTPKIESLGHPNDFGLREHDVSQTSVAYHFSPFLSSLLQNLQMWPFYGGKGTLIPHPTMTLLPLRHAGKGCWQRASRLRHQETLDLVRSLEKTINTLEFVVISDCINCMMHDLVI